MEGPEAQRLRALEDENGKLKQLLADAVLEDAGLKDLLSKKWCRPQQSVKRSHIFRPCLDVSERQGVQGHSGGQDGFATGRALVMMRRCVRNCAFLQTSGMGSVIAACISFCKETAPRSTARRSPRGHGIITPGGPTPRLATSLQRHPPLTSKARD